MLFLSAAAAAAVADGFAADLTGDDAGTAADFFPGTAELATEALPRFTAGVSVSSTSSFALRFRSATGSCATAASRGSC